MFLRSKQTSMSQPQAPEGVKLAQRLGGERVLPLSGPDFVLPFSDFRRHAVVLGVPGSGKTETLMRLAHGIAQRPDVSVFYLDAKGDRANAERFMGLMSDLGRECRVFPNERFCAWRGDWRGVLNRLLKVIEFAEEGAAVYYRDIAKSVLQLACYSSSGPPRSSAELLERLSLDWLRRSHAGSSALRALNAEQIAQVRMRYEAFFGQVGTSLDGSWAWEDANTGYLLLDAMALGEDASNVASLVFADFAHYFAIRKPRDRFCVLIVDEFSAIASRADMAVQIEQARGFNTSLILATQVVAGMGDDEQRERILGSVETVVVHALNDPEKVISLAGTRLVPDVSYQAPRLGEEREDHVRFIGRLKIDPAKVRGLSPGEAWIIRRGAAARVGVYRAPLSEGVLPPPEPFDPPLHTEAEEPEETGVYEEPSSPPRAAAKASKSRPGSRSPAKASSRKPISRTGASAEALEEKDVLPSDPPKQVGYLD